MNNDKLYKVMDTYYRLGSIQSMSELGIGDNCGIGHINGKKLEWYIGFSHYKQHYQKIIISRNETYQEYKTLLKAFKEQYGWHDEVKNVENS